MLNGIFAIGSTIAVSLVSLAGIISLSIKPQKLQNILLYLVSLSVGVLFGDAFIHLIPESYAKNNNELTVSLLILVGILLFFILEKFIHWRHCHRGGCDEHSRRPIAAMNIAGDALHNLIDGMLIGASYLAGLPIGISTTMAVILHEIPQEIGDFGVLMHGGFSVNKALFFNFLSALMAVLGAMISLIIGTAVAGYTNALLPITAGGFIYIAGSDLIPELHHDSRPAQALRQLAAILLGIGLMIVLRLLG